MAPPFLTTAFLRQHRMCCFTIAVLAFIAFVRLRLLHLPFERDEGEYAYIGQLMLHGVPPYQSAYTMKFPGTAAMYALIMAVFGQTVAGVHFGLTCLTTATAVMLYGLAKKMFDPVAGTVAATAYAVMAASPGMLGLAGHATHFAAFFVTAGLFVLWPAGKKFEPWHVAVAGIFFGLAILMKQHSALVAIWVAIMVATVAWRRSEWSVTRKIAVIGMFAGAVLLPFGVCCLVLWHDGVFATFWFWTVDYSRKYEAIRSVSTALLFLRVSVPLALSTTLVLWLLGAFGFFRLWNERQQAACRWLAGFGVASALTVVPGFYFREHYFLLVLPAIALLAGYGLRALEGLWQRMQAGRRWVALPFWFYGALIAVVVINNAGIWLGKTPVAAAHTIYEDELFIQAPAVAGFVHDHSPPDARVAVLGSEPEIYFLADRRSATGYIYTLPLLETQPLASAMMREMTREVETNAPLFIVFTEHFTTWGGNPRNDPVFGPWWAAYRTNYDLVGAVTPPDVQVRAVDAVEGRSPATVDGFEIYRRKGVEMRGP